MKNFSRILSCVSVFAMIPVFANAAGTYYNGNMYQNPQMRYGANGGGFYNSYGANNYNANRGYAQGMQTMGVRKNTTTITKKKTQKTQTNAAKQGFALDVGVSHEFANWDVEMKNAGSRLKYDGLRWNTVDGHAAYYFGGSTPMQVVVGAKYGVQFDEISMVDDDITTEKMWETLTLSVDGNTEYAITGSPALSVGTGSGGTQFGFNAAFGLTDLFKIGNMKITPSIGYRYLKYELETKNNYGLVVDVLNSDSFVNCIEVSGGEIQCSPYVGFVDNTGKVFSYAGITSVTDADGNVKNVILNNTSASQLDLGNTYYYEQDGVSHSYETTWAGPYIALDMVYDINETNLVNMGVEFGLPMYDSKGDQPYRIDWAHPTSVEDKGDFGDAYHIGLNGNWLTRVSDNMSLSFGFTYDYYHVSGATANTYLNTAYYQDLLDQYLVYYDQDRLTEAGLAYLEELQDLKSDGWKMESKSEIESIYKSLGIRVGLNIKF